VGVLVFVIEVVRRRRLSEGYALLWIAVGFAGVLLGVSRHVIDKSDAHELARALAYDLAKTCYGL